MNTPQSVELVLIISSTLALVVLALAALLHRRTERRSPNPAAIRQYRDWQGQCASWSSYWELEEMIDEERAKDR